MGAELSKHITSGGKASDPTSLDRDGLGGQQLAAATTSPHAPTTLGVSAPSELQVLAGIGIGALTELRTLHDQANNRFGAGFQLLAKDGRIGDDISKVFRALLEIESGSADSTLMLSGGLAAKSLASHLQQYNDHFKGVPYLHEIIEKVAQRLLYNSAVDINNLTSSLEGARNQIERELRQDAHRTSRRLSKEWQAFRATNAEELERFQKKLIERATKLQATGIDLEKLDEVLQTLSRAIQMTDDKSEHEGKFTELLKASVALRNTSFNSAALENIIELAVEGLASARLGYGVECVRRSPKGFLAKLAESVTGKDRAAWISALGDDGQMTSTIDVLLNDFSIRVPTRNGFDVIIDRRAERNRAEITLESEVNEQLTGLRAAIDHGEGESYFYAPESAYVPEDWRIPPVVIGGAACVVGSPLLSLSASVSSGDVVGTFLWGGTAVVSTIALCRAHLVDTWVDHSKPTNSEALERFFDFCKENQVELQYRNFVQKLSWKVVSKSK